MKKQTLTYTNLKKFCKTWNISLSSNEGEYRLCVSGNEDNAYYDDDLYSIAETLCDMLSRKGRIIIVQSLKNEFVL